MLKDILVHLDASPSSERRLEAATLLAERNEAHLVGLFVNSLEGAIPYRESYSVFEAMQYLSKRNAADEAATEAMFRRAVAGGAFSAEWRAAEGRIDQTVAQHARAADLAVLGQYDPEHPSIGSGASVPSYVPLASGRPALIVPYAGHVETLGRRVLVAWDGGREAARAVNDALPLLKTAEQVTVITITTAMRSGSQELPYVDIAAHLARHGVTVDARIEPRCDDEIADLLLSFIADHSVDLLVMGSYGHSEMRELLLGGVTRAILTRMTVPVLMSH
ncbi:MAG TPA: universal stress protein [Aliidongia sp.]|nr:universal stress protein [Aliidongia sp.]